MKQQLTNIYRQKDKWWTLVAVLVLLVVAVWDMLFLNRPALNLLFSALGHTLFVAGLVSLFSLLAGWAFSYMLLASADGPWRGLHTALRFVLNLVRSVPQLIGILLGYVGLTVFLVQGNLSGTWLILLLMATVIAIFIFAEMVDLLEERITYFKRLDFYDAMRVCGIPRRKIIHVDILWQNSRLHIINKLIAVFGMSIFLQCSVDFIISVGLSTEVSSVNLPVTLGSLLAKIDSKQDILAIGYSLTHPSYFTNLFFEHLQGVSVAFLIVFLLWSLYKIGNGYARRHRL